MDQAQERLIDGRHPHQYSDRKTEAATADVRARWNSSRSARRSYPGGA
jgi:hypothetical protein